MPAAEAHSWAFRSRFRASAFGWRSELPIKRIKEAVAEIKKAARKDKVLGAEGAVHRMLLMRSTIPWRLPGTTAPRPVRCAGSNCSLINTRGQSAPTSHRCAEGLTR
jgi:hypothetical protein